MKMKINKQTYLWTCKDGRRIRICDMTDDHLMNTIRMLERSFDNAIWSMAGMTSMLQGEMAIMHAENEIASMCVESMYPMYSVLVLDAERRGLMQ